ncbi:hypothetical protein ACJX0J_035939, partial [Zea mays]
LFKKCTIENFFSHFIHICFLFSSVCATASFMLATLLSYYVCIYRLLRKQELSWNILSLDCELRYIREENRTIWPVPKLRLGLWFTHDWQHMGNHFRCIN